MMRKLFILPALGLFLAACPPEQPMVEDEVEIGEPVVGVAEEEMPEQARQAVDVARALEARPDAPEMVLQDRGMTMEQFEDLMFDVARDPDSARAYTEARQARL